MYYAIMTEDKPNTLSLRVANRAAHLKRLEILKSKNRLLAAGPHPAIDDENPK